MNDQFQETVLKATAANKMTQIEVIQELWSGYGVIARFALENSDHATVIVKHIALPAASNHPRGWNSDISHNRKMKSYEVESHWYQQWSKRCDERACLPKCLGVASQKNERLIILEDLDAAGFPLRKNSVSINELKSCIAWLAHFHASYLGEKPSGLWETGTYWHLDTRPDELKALDDLPLRAAAAAIDQQLKASPYQTFVHGDAKLANFCFSKDGTAVAAVDFQYVGGGCGMKDLAYLIGSCLYEEDCEAREAELLDHYFLTLCLALKDKKVDLDALEKDWRSLFPVAWTDFHRFIKGWSPGHWKINGYSERISKEVIASL